MIPDFLRQLRESAKGTVQNTKPAPDPTPATKEHKSMVQTFREMRAKVLGAAPAVKTIQPPRPQPEVPKAQPQTPIPTPAPQAAPVSATRKLVVQSSPKRCRVVCGALDRMTPTVLQVPDDALLTVSKPGYATQCVPVPSGEVIFVQLQLESVAPVVEPVAPVVEPTEPEKKGKKGKK